MAYLVHNLSVIRQSVWDHFGKGITIYWMGDASHAASVSDHNPASDGGVHAIDVMLPVGPRGTAVAKAAIGRWDLKYVIFNRTIWSKAYGWRARYYSGTNPHRDHIHISGQYDSASEARSVGLNLGTYVPPKPVAPRPKFTLAPWPFGTDHSKFFAPYTNSVPPVYKTISNIQHKLWSLGYTVGSFDGQYGPTLKGVILNFQKSAGLKADALIGFNTYEKLRSK